MMNMKINNGYNNRKKVDFHCGESYKNFFRIHRRYKIVKGSRASKKSTNISAYILLKILGNNYSNAICLRKYYDSLRDSCFAQLKKSAVMLGVFEKFQWKKSPLSVIKKSTGQVILFKGLKEANSLTSFTISKGKMDTVWLEEAWEIEDYLTWVKAEGTFRGYEKLEFIMTFNPWHKNWIYDYFFAGRLEDDPEVLEKVGWQEFIDEKMLLLITNHRINEFLTDEDHEGYLVLKKHDLTAYQVSSLGCWGSYDGLVYQGLQVGTHILPRVEIFKQYSFDYMFIGIDYALKIDSTTAVLVGINSAKGVVAILDEYGHSNAGLKFKKNFTQICSETVSFTKLCLQRYPAFAASGLCFVENQELSFQQLLTSNANERKIPVYFKPCKKTPIIDRIKVIKYLIGHERFIIATEAIRTKTEFISCTYDMNVLKESGKLIRSDVATDYINATEYALTDSWRLILNTFNKIELGEGGQQWKNQSERW